MPVSIEQELDASPKTVTIPAEGAVGTTLFFDLKAIGSATRVEVTLDVDPERREWKVWFDVGGQRKRTLDGGSVDVGTTTRTYRFPVRLCWGPGVKPPREFDVKARIVDKSDASQVTTTGQVIIANA